jgi:plastocyanin
MNRVIFIVVLLGIISIIDGCKKSDNVTVIVPSLTTSPITNITYTTATGGGNISSDGNATVTGRGICWSLVTNPSVSDSKTSDGSGTGQYASNITGLTPGTIYHVRAYATNSAGTAYGADVSFTTSLTQLAVLSTNLVTLIEPTTAKSGGSITDDGGSDITARGVCWSTVAGPKITDSHTSDGTGKGSFNSNLTGLTANTLYYVRAYAVNSTGTAYGNEITFTSGTVQGANEVLIQGMAFSPVTLTVSVNTTVTWTNNDDVSHTVTSDNGLFNSGSFAHVATYSHQFTTAGTYPYHCTIHPYMTATIIVQ